MRPVLLAASLSTALNVSATVPPAHFCRFTSPIFGGSLSMTLDPTAYLTNCRTFEAPTVTLTELPDGFGTYVVTLNF